MPFIPNDSQNQTANPSGGTRVLTQEESDNLDFPSGDRTAPASPTMDQQIKDAANARLQQTFGIPGTSGSFLPTGKSRFLARPGVSTRILSPEEMELDKFGEENPIKSNTAKASGLGIDLAEALTGRTPLTSGLGLAGGENIRTALNAILGVPSAVRQTPEETIKKTAVNLGLGALLSKLGHGAGSTAEKIVSGDALRAGANPEAAALNREAESLGVTLPAGSATQAPILQGAEKVIQHLPFGGSKMNRAFEQNTAQLDDAADRLLKSISSKGTPGSVAKNMTPSELGTSLQQSIKANERAFQTDASKAYEPFNNLEVNPDTSKQRASSLLEEITSNYPDLKGGRLEKTIQRMASIGEGKQTEGQKLMSGLSPSVLAKNPQLANAQSASTPTFDFNSANRFSGELSDLSKMALKQGDNQASALAQQAKSAIDADIENAISQKGPGFLKTYQDLKNWYAGKKEFFNAVKDKNIQGVPPEKVADLLIDPNSSTFVKYLKDNITEKQFEPYQREFAARVLDNPKKFIDNEETLSEVFNPQQLSDLKKFLRVSDFVNASKPSSEASSNTRLARHIIGYGGALSGIIFHHPVTGAVATLSGAPLASAFLNPEVRSLLIKGTQISPDTKEGIATATRLASILGLQTKTAQNLEDKAVNSIPSISQEEPTDLNSKIRSVSK